jgi:predicted neuraminidase
MEVVDMDRRALVYKGLPPDHTCCDQALRILPNGEWLVIFMTGGTVEPEKANYIALCRSTDQGHTWESAETVLRFEERACLFSEAFVYQDRVTVFVQTHAGGFEEWLNFTISSGDNGETWSEPAVFTPFPRRTFLRNLYVASWGEWVLPFQSYDTQDDPSPSPLKDGSFRNPVNGTLISSDAGASWECSNRIPGRCWAENNVVELSDGRLVMLIRADGTGCLYRSESTDRGRTWTEAVPTDIPNPGSKFRLFRLSDGRIVLLHNPNSATSHPNSKRQAACNRNPLALWVSEDDMASWGHQRVLTDFPGHLAYPDGVVDDDEGYVHFAFDYNRHDVIYWGAALPPACPAPTQSREH